MAKKRERIATGLSIQDIINMPMDKFRMFNEREQREIVSRLASAGNKRLKNLQKAGIENPATISVELSGGKFSVKGKSDKELESELFRAKQFLKSKYSTKREWNKTLKKINEGIKKRNKGYEDVTDYNAMAFSYYDVLQQLNPSFSAERQKYKIVGKVAEYLKDTQNPREIMDKINKDMQDEYLKEQERFNQENKDFGFKVNDDTPKRYKRKKHKRKKRGDD